MAHTVTERHFIAFSSADVTHIVGGTAVAGAPIAGDAEVTFDFGLLMSTNLPAALRRKKFALAQIEVRRATGASGTNYTPQVADVTASGATGWATKYLGTATAPGTRTITGSIDRLIYSSTAGRLFFKVSGDAADTFDYVVWFEVLG